MRTLKALFPKPQQSGTTAEGNELCPSYPLQGILQIHPNSYQICAASISLNRQILTVSETVEYLYKAELDDDQSTSPPHETIPPVFNPLAIAKNAEKACCYVEDRKLSPRQHKVTTAMLDYFLKLQANLHKYGRADLFQSMTTIENIHAPHALITGDPGAGKSYDVGTIVVELPSILQIGCVATTSYNGIAAVNVDGGTICSTFSIFDTSETGKHHSPDALMQLHHGCTQL
jgi:hypothetical protein